MSSYFAALMRASGLVPAEPARQYAIDPTAVSCAIEGEAVDGPAAAAMVISPADHGVEQARPQSRPMDQQRETQTARAQTSAPRLPREDAGAHPPSRTAVTAPPETAATQLASPNHELHVRAAMQWVRADPHVLENAEGAVPRSPLVDEPVLADRTTPSRGARAVSVENTPTRASPLQTTAVVMDARTPPVSHQQQPPAQENVEVSIGAIHLRIDGSPASTVVNAPAPAQRSTPTRGAARALPRSNLARRALRRI